MSSFSNRNTNNTKSVTLAPFSLVLFLKICSILKSLIRGVLLSKLIWWPISLMPSIRSLVFKRLARRFKLVAVILLLGEIMPTCFYYAEKGLLYITIVALSSRQPFSYTKCTWANMRSSYNIYLVSNAKCIFFIYFYTL